MLLWPGVTRRGRVARQITAASTVVSGVARSQRSRSVASLEGVLSSKCPEVVMSVEVVTALCSKADWKGYVFHMNFPIAFHSIKRSWQMWMELVGYRMWQLFLDIQLGNASLSRLLFPLVCMRSRLERENPETLYTNKTFNRHRHMSPSKKVIKVKHLSVSCC